MSDKAKVILILSGFFLVLAGVFGFGVLKDYLYNNPEDMTGNTTGNLNNGGNFCQVEDKIFFVNTYDGGKLYSMNVDESGITKLSDAVVSSINADDTYIYYVMSDVESPSGMGGISIPMLGIYRAKHNGKQVKCLDRVSGGVMKLLGNFLYYQRYEDNKIKTMQCMDIRTREGKALLDFPANPAAAAGTGIYYSGVTEDHNLYRYDITTGSSTLVYEGNVWNPDAQGGFVYFMNVEDGYTLCRYDVASGEVQTLTRDRMDSYLVCGNIIFYQRNSETEPALMAMNTDGSGATVIAEGNYNTLNATSKYLYFMEFGNEAAIYKVSLENRDFRVMTFDGARDAALENAAQ